MRDDPKAYSEELIGPIAIGLHEFSACIEESRVCES